jgi:3',5'-cyclic AMP phosphodiesterase CpdA
VRSSNPSRGRGLRRAVVVVSACAVLLAGACTSLTPPHASRTAGAAIEFVAFGDAGYEYEWLAAEDYAVRRSAREVAVEELDDWIEDKRPLGEFRLPPFHVLERTGGVVIASGRDPVAHAMQTYCAREGCGFGVMLGDNIYPEGATMGADGRDDAERFRDLLSDPFEPLAAGKRDFRIYAVLGNHDWYTSRAGALSQIAYMEQSDLLYMDGLRYRVTPPAAGGDVEIFALDTHVMLAAEKVYEPVLGEDGSEQPPAVLEEYDPWVAPQTPEERGMVDWLERALKESKARWKIVIGHHPLWSVSGGKFEQARVLRRLILPTLCRYADLYVAGHEHTLEVHTDDCRTAVDDPRVPPLVNIVSGSASKQRPVNSAFMADQDRRYPQKTTWWARGLVWGFVHIALEGDAGTVTVVTTPDSGTGEPVVAYSHAIARRSGGR